MLNLICWWTSTTPQIKHYMNTNKFIGSILIVIGTIIGGGMLGLPIISAQAGFSIAAVMLIAIWVILTITGLLTLEVNLAFEESANSFGTMAFRTLGTFGKVISWLCTLLLLYSLTAAYISGGASLLTNVIELILHVKTSNFISALIFTIVLGGMVFWSTKTVDYSNRFFLSIKGLTLTIILIILFPKVNLINITRGLQDNTGKSLIPMIPIFLCSFGFHPIIPSLSNYLGKKPRELKFAVIFGTSIALIIYILWLFVTLGIVPLSGTHGFIKADSSIGEFIKNIYTIADNKWGTLAINLFSNIAITTSFLGVTLGLFDFLADGFKRSDTHFGRLQTWLLTFIPPLIFALFFPKGFLLALNYAAFFATILIIIMPALMAYNLRKNAKLHSPYKVFGGKYLLIFIILVGIAALFVQISSLGAT